MKKFLIIISLILIIVISLCSCNASSKKQDQSSDKNDVNIENNEENNDSVDSETNDDQQNSDTTPPAEEICEHSPITVSGVDATCTTEGTTEYQKCSLCGELLTKPTIVEKIEHTYSPDLSACAEKECLVCKSIIPESHQYVLRKVDIDGSEEIERYGLFSCEICNTSKEESIEFNNAGIGVLSLEGSMQGISKENKVFLDATYYGDGVYIESPITIKWQGASSLSYEKKNFNIQFVDLYSGKGNKVEILEKWGKESKYTLKANYVDFSQARNVCSGKIYGKIVRSRNINDQFDSLVNGGAIDGFPIIIYINGEYQGLYTMNIPKDKWLFDMDKSGKQAIVMAEHWGESVSLRQNMSYDFTSTCWELEFCSTEDDPEIGTAWVVDSFNEMMNFVNNNTGDAFKNGIRKYINVERAIDSMIYTWIFHGSDNTAKNILWITYDGVQWSPSVYDMDDSWGLIYHGQDFYSPYDMMPNQIYTANMLWQRLYENHYDEIVARYAELRGRVLSYNSITTTFKNFIDSIPSALYYYEVQRWPDVPSPNENNLDQICKYVEKRLEAFDDFFNYNS